MARIRSSPPRHDFLFLLPPHALKKILAVLAGAAAGWLIFLVISFVTQTRW